MSHCTRTTLRFYSVASRICSSSSFLAHRLVHDEEGALAERYRAIHLARNKSYSQFIVGPDIAIITVHLQRARVCDVNDRVAHFAKQGEGWNEITQPSSPSGGSSPPRLS